jgi:hypothetical protein
METNNNVDSIELLCNHCGQTFSSFLNQMADQNSKVVCPNCRANVDCSPVKGARPVTTPGPAHKLH